MPPTEYLPPGNQNLVFGFIFSPPGYSVDEYKRMARIVEEGDGTDPYSGVRAFWEARLGTPSSEQIPDVVLPVGIKGDRLQRVKPPPIENFFYVAWAGQAFMGCTSQDPDNVAPLTHVMNRAGQRIPGVFTFFMQTSLFSSGGAGNSVDVEIRGDDLTAVADSASAILGKLMEVGYGYPSPNPPNFAQGRPEVRVIPNRAKAADLGLNVLDVGFIVEACVNGAFVGEYNDRGDRVDMVLRIEGLNSATSEEVARVPIVTPSGHVVPLLSAADLQRTTAPQQINHIEEMGSVTLSVQSKTGVPLQETMREIEDSVIAPLRASGIVPSTVITGLAGTASKLTQTQNALLGDFRETFTRPRLLGLSAPGSTILLAMLVVVVALAVRMIAGPRPATMTLVLLGIAVAVAVMSMNPQFARALVTSRMMLALLITYLLMAALFESFIYPFIIMFAVPPAAFGGVAALQIVHYISLNDVTVPVQQLDVLTMLGFVILIGVVVNNAILIVHQALNNMREGGMDPYAAVAYSVQTRTRPIFMTAFTSLFGMLPLVVMPGAGSELYRGLGAVVLGGLLVSTVFTLVVIPAMFTLFLDLQRWWVASKGVVRTATSPALAAVSEGATSS